jgi:hypothetical protein
LTVDLVLLGTHLLNMGFRRNLEKGHRTFIDTSMDAFYGTIGSPPKIPIMRKVYVEVRAWSVSEIEPLGD